MNLVSASDDVRNVLSARPVGLGLGDPPIHERASRLAQREANQVPVLGK